MGDTIFDKILKKEIPSFPIYEDDKYLAFLTPFANTPGVSILIPKHNPGDYIFDIEDKQYIELFEKAKIVAKKIKKGLAVSRVALVIEGTGVPFVHIKLYPLHGPKANETGIFNDITEFNEDYRGYITTLEGPKMDDDRLIEIQEKIRGASI